MPAIPVAVTGVTWTAVLVFITNLILGGGLVTWMKMRPKMREITASVEDKLRSDLITRVGKLEQKLDAERDRYEALIAIMRHRLNNSDQCIDALILLLKSSLDPVTQRAVQMIEEMRARQREAEASEKASYHAANLARAGVIP